MSQDVAPVSKLFSTEPARRGEIEKQLFRALAGVVNADRIAVDSLASEGRN